MSKYISVYLIVLFSVLVSSCVDRIDNEADLYKWMNDPKNGLVKEKTVGEINIRVKYLPPQYLTLNELKRMDTYAVLVSDSILESYLNSRTFLLQLSTNDAADNADIMMWGVGSKEAYTERSMKMNFHMNEYITLHTDLGSYKPVLFNLENVYGLSTSRNILFVFTEDEQQQDLLQSEQLDFVFEDDLFNSGINHFTFQKSKIDNFPEINFRNLLQL